jgi:predicted HAD superfamily Cof-like phosphohydrolase
MLDMVKSCREHAAGVAVRGAIPRQDIENLCDEVEQLRAELKHHKEHVTQLQKRSNVLLAQRRGIRYLVHDFHSKFGYPVCTVPHVPDDDVVRFRLALIAEEFIELLEASIVDNGALTLAKSFVMKSIRGEQDGVPPAPVMVDLAELADAMADLDYVVEGTRLTFGIDGWPVLLEVQRANMSKENTALKAADAAKVAGTTKAQKPEGWTPPDIAGELEAQGWRSAHS